LHGAQLIKKPEFFNDPDFYITLKWNGKKIWNKEVNIATYGYAISAHKSQGNEWDNVYIDSSWLSSEWNHSRWMYTAVTRAKKQVEILHNSYIFLVNE